MSLPSPLPEISQSALPGTLYIIATPIGNLADITLRALSILNSSDLIACEDTRVTHNLLHHFNIKKPTLSYRDDNERTQTPLLIQKLLSGSSISLVSDAGTPTLSDPGFRIIRECRKLNIPVVPIPGPCAAITALSVSGLPSDRFLFIGFLPPKSSARISFFNEFKDYPHTLILYESSHRILPCLEELISVLGPTRTISLARELTKKHESFYSGHASSVLQNLQASSSKGEFTLLIAPQSFNL